MKKEVQAAVITGILGLIATISAAVIATQHEKNQQNQYIHSQLVSIVGDDNEVVVNSVEELVENYQKLTEENERLKDQNSQYFNDYKITLAERDSLKSQLGSSPSVQLKNMRFYMYGEDTAINKNNSYAIINGAEYFSRDFVNKLAGNTASITIQEDAVYLGRVVSGQKDLLSLRIVDSSNCKTNSSFTDSYGNTHAKTLRLTNRAKITYSLNEAYSLLRLKIAIEESSYGNRKCVLTIKADDEVIYTSEQLDKVTTKELDTGEININNCSRIELSCTGDYDIYPLIYDAIVYN